MRTLKKKNRSDPKTPLGLSLADKPPVAPDDRVVAVRMSYGFTLIEVAVVVVLIGLLAGATALRPIDWFRSAQMEEAVGRLAWIDQQARGYAMRFDRPVGLRFDLTAGTAVRVDLETNKPQSHRVRLPHGFAMKRVVTAHRRVDSGKVTLPCTAQQHTPTYAVLVAGPSGESQWVVVVGLTGQVIAMDREQGVKEALGLVGA